MTIFCTYCSADKEESKNKLPAIQRYKSDRIKSVYNAAMTLGVKFLILSGKHGILKSDEQIHYYDQILKSSKVQKHSIIVANQLNALGVKDIIFFYGATLEDNNIQPYLNCMKLAAKKTGIEIKFVCIKIKSN